jgi:hypothetical protein
VDICFFGNKPYPLIEACQSAKSTPWNSYFIPDFPKKALPVSVELYRERKKRAGTGPARLFVFSPVL